MHSTSSASRTGDEFDVERRSTITGRLPTIQHSTRPDNVLFSAGVGSHIWLGGLTNGERVQQKGSGAEPPAGSTGFRSYMPKSVAKKSAPGFRLGIVLGLVSVGNNWRGFVFFVVSVRNRITE